MTLILWHLKEISLVRKKSVCRASDPIWPHLLARLLWLSERAHLRVSWPVRSSSISSRSSRRGRGWRRSRSSARRPTSRLGYGYSRCNLLTSRRFVSLWLFLQIFQRQAASGSSGSSVMGMAAGSDHCTRLSLTCHSIRRKKPLCISASSWSSPQWLGLSRYSWHHHLCLGKSPQPVSRPQTRSPYLYRSRSPCTQLHTCCIATGMQERRLRSCFGRWRAVLPCIALCQWCCWRHQPSHPCRMSWASD